MLYAADLSRIRSTAAERLGSWVNRTAAGHLGIDLAASWWIGDRLRDVLNPRLAR